MPLPRDRMRLCFSGVLLCLALCLGARAEVEEIGPLHLFEDAEAEARAEPLIIHDASDAPYYYEPIEHTDVHTQRQRREPRPDGFSSYWYHNIFHHTHDRDHAKKKFGPDRPNVDTINSKSPPNELTVAAYYYPWYHTDFHGRKYIRGELKPPQLPVLGEYNDRNENVIRQHLAWSRQANISVWVSSWWGPGSGTDTTIRNHILPHPDLDDMKLCLFYETMGRIDVETRDFSNVYDDISYAAEHFFGNPNYFRINGRPVMFVYLTRSLERQKLLRDVVATIRTAAYERGGHLLYIVGDHTHGAPPEGRKDAFDWLDAVTNYDIFGAMGRPNKFAGKKAVKEFSREQAAWKKAANKQGCAYIAGATPGYNDQAVRDGDYTAMSRKLGRRKKEGSLFRALLREGIQLVDGFASNMIVVNSFNEWHEDTQIEPVVRGKKTKRPWKLTKGQVYRGYGELYLNILRQETEDK